jgi:signal transduction histidine kinase/CheY-like chemotaxis protein
MPLGLPFLPVFHAKTSQTTHGFPRKPPAGRFRRAGALLAAAFLFLLPGTLSAAEKPPRKTVRVPCVELNRVMLADDHGHPVSGYAYDYIQTIATYAGWKVEYVPAANFSDGMQKLLSGEADLFYEVSWTEERSHRMLFPDEPMGFEYYYLYATKANEDITPDDYASLQGKKVGVTVGTMQIELLRQWCEKKKVDLDFVYYKDLPVKETDLRAGNIDLDYEVSMMAQADFSAVEKVGSSSYYLAVNKDRPDLIADIDSAMDKILNNDIYTFTRLQEQYFSDMVHSRNLTGEEKEWVAEHQILRAGYFDNYLPFSTKDENGRPIGSFIDALREILRVLELEDRLQLEFTCYSDQKEAFKAVEAGEIDLLLPAYVSGSVKRDFRIIGGKGLGTLASDLAFLEEYDDDAGKRIAVNRNNLMQYYYSRDCYPKSEIVFYDGIHECLDGILQGTSDGTFLNGARAAALLRPEKYRPLRLVRARDAFQLCMAFAADDIGLMLLMNRGVTMLDDDFISEAMYTYAGWMAPLTLADFLRDHIVGTIVWASVLAGLVAAVVAFRLRNRELKGVNRELLEKNKTIERQRREEFDLRTELEKKQSALEEALHMAQAANRAKTTFLSNMSHDIRTPMNAIIGFTGLAASHIGETERVRDYLRTIAQSSEHLLALINDVLDMSRIESGKTILHEKVESLAEILHALRDIVHADIQAKQHNFFIDTVDVRDERVYCDKMHLNQVLFNLVSNAIKFTPTGGTISLRIVQKPAAKPGYASFEFRCKDNGIGMDGEFAKTIFDPFTREESSTVSGIEGTGLGMAIAKNIVEMMGGRISVSSEKGKGTEFVVSLDFRVAGGKAEDPVIPELKGLRSLVVDDDVGACQSIADMLRAVGMRSEWCVSGREAVIRTEESLRHGDCFKVYVVDWLMPDMNGVETVRRIRKVVGEDASIIILTAYDWADIEQEAREAGVTGFLSKPLFPSDLKRVLLQACGKETPVPQEKELPAFSLAGKRILMVDDSALNLKIGVLLLREQGAVVDTAGNGKAAVEAIREKGAGAYDFVVMDVQMPVMDGYEATAAIRKLPDGGKMKIIAFSANAFEEDREKSLAAGMDGHIAKPLKIDAFLKELQRFAS